MNASSKEVNVILPTVASPSLDIAIRSIQRQSLPVRLVLVDDRRDRSWPLSEVAPTLTSIAHKEVIETGGRGLAEARNMGLAAVHGGNILLLDDDDVWCPHHERLQVASRSGTPPLVWSACRVVIYGTEEAVTTAAGFGWSNIGELLWSTNFIPPSSVLVPAERSLRFDSDLHDLEDWDAWLNLLRTREEPAYTGVVTMGYGRDISSKASMTMTATEDSSRQVAMLQAYEYIASRHRVPEGFPDLRDSVRKLRNEHIEAAGSGTPLTFDYYEQALADLVGAADAPFCCDFDFASEYDRLNYTSI